MKRLISLMAVLMWALGSIAMAADNLPLNNQEEGMYAGVEASTSYMHVVTKSQMVKESYTIANPVILVTTGYATDLYSLGVFGGAGFPSIRNAFDQLGNANGTVPVFGANAKIAPAQIGDVKAGLVADIKYVGNSSDGAAGTLAGCPLTVGLDYGPLWIWSAGAIAQYQPSKSFALYAGEKYEDLAKADATMRAAVQVGQKTFSKAIPVKFREMDNFSTVAGVVIMPTSKVNITLQGKYTESVPMAFTVNAEYRF